MMNIHCIQSQLRYIALKSTIQKKEQVSPLNFEDTISWSKTIPLPSQTIISL